MASTDDCKQLLDSTEALAGLGPWKRLAKRKASDGVERVFVSKDASRFVRLLENDQGDLRLSRIASSLSLLDVAPIGQSPAATSKTPAVKSASSPRSGSPLHNIEYTASVVVEVRRAVKLWLSDITADPSALVEIGQRHPVALANEFIFAVSQDPDQEVFVEIVPRAFWKSEKVLCDFPLPLDGILPGDECESPNESSTYLLYGFDDDAKAMTIAMLNAGFEWSEDLQSATNKNMEIPASVSQKFTAWMKGAKIGQALDKSRATQAPPAQVKVQTVTSEEDFQALVNFSNAPRAPFSLTTKPTPNNPPLAYALVVCPPLPDTGITDASLHKLVSSLSAYDIQVILITSGSPAAESLRTRLNLIELNDCEVVGLREGQFDFATATATLALFMNKVLKDLHVAFVAALSSGVSAPPAPRM